MRMIRSLVCAGIAMMAVAVIAAMPAAAAVPIDPGVFSLHQADKSHQVPAAVHLVHEATALPASVLPAHLAQRSYGLGEQTVIASTSVNQMNAPCASVPPDIRMRC